MNTLSFIKNTLVNTKSYVMTTAMTMQEIIAMQNRKGKERFCIQMFKSGASDVCGVRIHRLHDLFLGESMNGYWVPQGSFVDIPVFANENDFVFTPDFSGCALLIDQVNSDTYRVYHVQGGREHHQREYASKEHYIGLNAGMVFNDYGSKENPRGYAFMKYENGRWWIYYQSVRGAPLVAGRDCGPQAVLRGGKIPASNLLKERPQIQPKVQSGFNLSFQGNPIFPAAPGSETWGPRVI